MTPEKKKDLRLFAIRVRESILKSIQSTKSGRPGGSLSAADYFTYLYQNELRIDPTQPRDENRDRFVFPRGMLPQPIRHTGLERFLFRRKSAASAPYSRPSSGASQHEHYPPPSVEMSTGSLGQGAAVGMAKGSKHLGKVLRVYTLLGDAQAEGAARHMTPTIFMIS